MKTEIETKTLRDAITIANAIKISRQLPVLSYAKLTVNHGDAKLVTTDLERVIEVSLNTKGQDEFTILLPRRRTQKFLSGKNGDTSIELDGNNKVILSRKELGNLQFRPSRLEDFPPIPTPNNDTIWSTIDAKWFCQMLDILIPACAQEMSRPILVGAVFSDNAMASADGFRLVSIKSDKLNFGLTGKRVIVPSQTLDIAKRLFGKENAVSIGFHDPDKVYFKSDKILLTSETILGNYPNYEVLIPTEYTCKASFSAPLMMQRLNMIDAKALGSGITRLQFQRTEPNKEPECLITGGTKDEDFTEYYSMRLPVKIETQKESKIALQYKYLCDAVKPFSICSVELTSLASPIKFTGDIEGLTIVVMPMYVQWE